MEYSTVPRCSRKARNGGCLAALNSGTAQRNQLWQPSNLAATGVLDDPVVCQAVQHPDAGGLCRG